MTSRFRAAAALATLALALAGCSPATAPAPAPATASATPTPTPQAVSAVYTKATEAAKAASSVAIDGTMANSGKPITLSVAGKMDGTNVKASFTSPEQGAATILVVDGQAYIKGDATFWKAAGVATPSQDMLSKYVAAPVDEAIMKDLRPSDLMSGALGAAKSDLGNQSGPVTESTVNGKKVYVLKSTTGTNSMTVSADGSYLLQSIDSTDKDAGTLTFTQWNSVPPIAAPPAAEVLKI